MEGGAMKPKYGSSKRPTKLIHNQLDGGEDTGEEVGNTETDLERKREQRLPKSTAQE